GISLTDFSPLRAGVTCDSLLEHSARSAVMHKAWTGIVYFERDDRLDESSVHAPLHPGLAERVESVEGRSRAEVVQHCPVARRPADFIYRLGERGIQLCL